MAEPGPTAAGIVEGLRALRSEAELAKVRKRISPDEEAFGVRMRDLFDLAKANTDLPLDQLERLLAEPAYESRLAALCILDFKARQRREDSERRAFYDIYMGHHDRITTWDMVDRSAPRVVGGYLAGRSLAPLHTLAAARQPLRRRTAITAPLAFVKSGSERDLAGGFEIAALLAADPDPIVCRPVGIFLKHAGTRDEAALRAFLAEHGDRMPAPARRLAREKLA